MLTISIVSFHTAFPSQFTCSCLILAVVCARAFINSQTANAHLILFRRIFEIATSDTGIPVMFRHIHGSGIESVVTDSHKGQALGRPTFV